jgi:serine/threonine protein kinase
MTNDEPDLTGLVLDGRYALVRRIGVGGMGAVYEARHVRISKPVAVKVLNREFAYKESFRRRFLREAQAASLIQHKNVVAIHDHGEHGDVAYIVMELLEGRDLHALVHDRAPLPWAEARSILLQTAATTRTRAWS